MENTRRSFLRTSSKEGLKILSASLTWFGIGLVFVFGLGFAFTKISAFNNIYQSIASSPHILLILALVAVIAYFIIQFKVTSLDFATLIILFSVYCLYDAFLVSTVFIVYAQSATDIIMLLAAPCAIFAVMGFLGYTQVFNFGKLIPFLITATIAMLVVILVGFFINLPWIQTAYCLLGVIIFSLYIGFDMWRISKTQEMLLNPGFDVDRKYIWKLGCAFGLNLLMDFVRVFYFLARLFK